MFNLAIKQDIILSVSKPDDFRGERQRKVNFSSSKTKQQNYFMVK